MYPISDAVKQLFKKHNRQVVEITVAGQDETIILNESNIRGITINRYSVTGSRIEIGSAVASELRLKIENNDGQFNDFRFEGAECFVRVGVVDDEEDGAINYVPMGYFTIDQAPRKLKVISLSALDRMVLFDKEVDTSLLSFPMTVSALLGRVCEICNVQDSVGSLSNFDYVVNQPTFLEGTTYRQIISWIAEISGTCAFIDWEGRLRMKWYEQVGEAVDLSDRFSSNVEENEIRITGVQINEYVAGEKGYVFTLNGNKLISHDYQEVADNLYSELGGFTYTPFTATIHPSPYLYPLDMVMFVKPDDHVPCIVSDVTFTLNGNTSIAGKGETDTSNSYARQNPLTNRERTIIERMEQSVNDTLNNRVQNVLAFNELISNAMGLYVTTMTQTDGSSIVYMHNKPSIEDSENIFTMTANGIAWTADGWNGGSPVWSYGASSAGDAFFRMLSAEGIEVSKVGADYHIEITPQTFSIYYKEMPVTVIDADQMTIPKASITHTLEIGKIRFIPYSENGVVVGTNIVYVD